MWIRLTVAEVRAVAHYLGVLTIGLGLAMTAPLIVAMLYGEWDPALDYLLGIALAVAVGATLMLADVSGPPISHRQAFLITPLAWVIGSAIGAVPLALSGHYAGYLDAAFESVSGFTTSGLTLVQDLDHMAYAHNMWRHLMHLIGGQGIIVAAVSLAIGLRRGGAFSLYLAEGRNERILPNVVHTARFIWVVTAVWVGLGTVMLTALNAWNGMALDRAGLHAFWITVAAYDTGGFAPQSQNAMYYHSPLFETMTMFLMLAGTLNFNLHADLWRGDFKEILENIEARTLLGNMLVLAAFAGAGAAMSGLYGTDSEILRKGLYHIVSANSGTGHQTLYPARWHDLGSVAFFSVILAMAFGGMVSSTAGGIKSLRIGLIIKSIVLEVRRMLSPESAVVRTTFHHLIDRPLTSQLASSALMVFVLYIVTYLTGGLAGAAYGYPLDAALFEAVSATANVGLSSGITSPGMPTGLKLLYMFMMWAGRLEFLTLLSLIFAALLSVVPRRVLR